MPDVALSLQIPASATWIKVHYAMKPIKPGADLIARLWSGSVEDAVVIKGESGDAFVKLGIPKHLSYQRPVTVDLKIKIVAYKAEAD